MFLNRHDVPVHQHLLFESAEAAAGAARGDLRMAYCGVCAFVFNDAFEAANVQYGAAYDNAQEHSPCFSAYLDDLIRYLVAEKSIRNATIVEVGCGQGGFLRALVSAHEGNVGYGFDPSYRGPARDLAGRLTFQNRYYGPECAEVAADVVICRHVIEHVPDPIGLLRRVRQALANSPRAQVFFETPCVEWILRNRVLWDFFYEHCSYFTTKSLSRAFHETGFLVTRLQHAFGGQYLWLEAAPYGNGGQPVNEGAVPVAALAEAYAADERRLQEDWRRRIVRWNEDGAFALWGAGAKGVTFANLIDSSREVIDCVVDLNPAKQGRFIAGTGHPIVDYRALKTRGVRRALLMNPNYRGETLALLEEAAIDVELSDE